MPYKGHNFQTIALGLWRTGHKIIDIMSQNIFGTQDK
jgi:hypothetical protein